MVTIIYHREGCHSCAVFSNVCVNQLTRFPSGSHAAGTGRGRGVSHNISSFSERNISCVLVFSERVIILWAHDDITILQ